MASACNSDNKRGQYKYVERSVRQKRSGCASKETWLCVKRDLQKRCTIMRERHPRACANLTTEPCVSQTHCNNTATHCNTLRHTATHCNCNTLQKKRRADDLDALIYLQHPATHCNTLQHTATHCNTLQHTTTTTQRNKRDLLPI